jgi:hypothetical protein
MSNKQPKTGTEADRQAAVIALNFMAFLAKDESRLQRFCALTGSTPQDLRAHLARPDFQAMALDYGLQDESLLLAFAAEADIDPLRIVAARRHLPGFTE